MTFPATRSDSRSAPAGWSRIAPFVTVAAALLIPTSAGADTQGLHVGLLLHANHLDSADETTVAPVLVDERGGGARLFFGYGFDPSFSLRLSVTASRHDTSRNDIDFEFSSGTLEGVYLFRNPDAFRPYLYGGVGGMLARATEGALDFETRGPGVVFGGGLLYFPTPDFAVDFHARADFINWEEEENAVLEVAGGTTTVERPIEREGTGVQLGFGISGWF
jgi:opacity protein-like surface antigen